MPLDWSPFTAFVHRHERFFLTTHTRPDPDGLGSLQALAAALESLGKRVDRVIPSRMPPRYQFLDPDRKITAFAKPGDQFRACDAAVVLDTGTWNQLEDVGSFLRTFPGDKAVVDHHATQDDLGALRLVDVESESTGRLADEAIRALGVPLTSEMANGIFAAVATDTGWFRHPSTKPRTHYLAGDLIASGADPTSNYESLYEKTTLQRLRLHGRALDRLQLIANGKIAYLEVRVADYAATGATPLDTEDLVNYPRSIEGVEVGLLFIEQREGGLKVSFRSRRIDVAKIAEQFGGGGHKLASGATVAGPYESARDRVLHAVELAANQL